MAEYKEHGAMASKCKMDKKRTNVNLFGSPEEKRGIIQEIDLFYL